MYIYICINKSFAVRLIAHRWYCFCCRISLLIVFHSRWCCASSIPYTVQANVRRLQRPALWWRRWMMMVSHVAHTRSRILFIFFSFIFHINVCVIMYACVLVYACSVAIIVAWLAHTGETKLTEKNKENNRRKKKISIISCHSLFYVLYYVFVLYVYLYLYILYLNNI